MLQIIKYSNINNFDLDKIKNYIVLFEIEIASNKNLVRKEIDNLKEILKNNNFEKTSILVKIKNVFNHTTSFIENLRNIFDIVFGFGGLNKINRFFIETNKIDFLVNPHSSFFKTKFDYLHHFNSGLNHLLANVSRQKGIKFITTLNFLDDYKNIIFYKGIGRVNQNLKIFKKYKLENYFCYFCENEKHLKKGKEILDILNVFDIDKKIILQNQKTLENFFEEKKKLNSKNYISKGIKILED